MSTFIETYSFSIPIGPLAQCSQSGFDPKSQANPVACFLPASIRKTGGIGHLFYVLLGDLGRFAYLPRLSFSPPLEFGLGTGSASQSPDYSLPPPFDPDVPASSRNAKTLRFRVVLRGCWGTWDRTKIHGFKGRRPTIRRSPNRSLASLRQYNKK